MVHVCDSFSLGGEQKIPNLWQSYSPNKYQSIKQQPITVKTQKG